MPVMSGDILDGNCDITISTSFFSSRSYYLFTKFLSELLSSENLRFFNDFLDLLVMKYSVSYDKLF